MLCWTGIHNHSDSVQSIAPNHLTILESPTILRTRAAQKEGLQSSPPPRREEEGVAGGFWVALDGLGRFPLVVSRMRFLRAGGRQL